MDIFSFRSLKRCMLRGTAITVSIATVYFLFLDSVRFTEQIGFLMFMILFSIVYVYFVHVRMVLGRGSFMQSQIDQIDDFLCTAYHHTVRCISMKNPVTTFGTDREFLVGNGTAECDYMIWGTFNGKTVKFFQNIEMEYVSAGDSRTSAIIPYRCNLYIVENCIDDSGTYIVMPEKMCNAIRLALLGYRSYHIPGLVMDIGVRDSAHEETAHMAVHTIQALATRLQDCISTESALFAINGSSILLFTDIKAGRAFLPWQDKTATVDCMDRIKNVTTVIEALTQSCRQQE